MYRNFLVAITAHTTDNILVFSTTFLNRLYLFEHERKTQHAIMGITILCLKFVVFI